MKQGHFYFIADKFYSDFGQDEKLMQNKEAVNGIPIARPCFYAFADEKNQEIFWCIPISSKTEKYEAIVQKKVEKQHGKGIKNPRCNTIVFCDVMGRRRAFLIQNMFPVTQKYIDAPYINKNTQSEVRITEIEEKSIIKDATEVLKVAFRGIPVLFTDVVSIYKQLQHQLEQERTVAVMPRSPTPKPSIQERLAAAKETVAQREADRREGPQLPPHKSDPER